jgi:arginine/lysine/ornithine decarboxylase
MDVTPTIKDRYFFPGHCGGEYAPRVFKKLYGSDILHYDLPELDGLDNIHLPEGPLLRALQLAAALFGAKQSWFLVNGSTSGILSAVFAAAQIHQRSLLTPWRTSADHRIAVSTNSPSKAHPKQRSVMLMGRDSHKASFDGLRLADCDGALLPCVYDEEFGIPLGIDFDSVSAALDTYGSQVLKKFT